MKYDVEQMENSDKHFYVKMGKFLSKREIVKEIGINVWDDDTNKWFIVFDNLENVMGFSSVSIKNGYGKINTFYVIPEYRKKGIAKAILTSILKYCVDNNIQKINVTSTELGNLLYKQCGFIEVGIKGKYKLLTLNLVG